MCWLKAKQILLAIGVGLVILIFLEITLLVPLLGGTSTVKVGSTPARPAGELESTLVLLFFGAMAILCGEAARVFIRKSFALDASKIKVQPHDAASALGTLSLVRDVIMAPLLPLVAFIVNLVLLVVLANQIMSKGLGGLPLRFWLVLGLFMLYLILRPVLAVALRPAARAANALMPNFTFDRNSVTLDLKRTRALPPSQRKFISIGTVPCLVKIGFDELSEIRAFAHPEAQSFVQYEVGPDLQLGLQGGTDLYRYLNGELDRPSVYGHWGSMGTTLLLKGPELFYLVSVSNTNVNDLLAAFQAYRQSLPLGAPG